MNRIHSCALIAVAAIIATGWVDGTPTEGIKYSIKHEEVTLRIFTDWLVMLYLFQNSFIHRIQYGW